MQHLSNFYRSRTWAAIKSLSKTPVAITVYGLLITGGICYLIYLLYLANYWLAVNNYFKNLNCQHITIGDCSVSTAIVLTCLELLLITPIVTLGWAIYTIFSDTISDFKRDMEKFDLESGNLENKRHS